MSSIPTSTDDLILPTASQDISRAVSLLKRSDLSISNRLESIYQDSIWVRHVCDYYNLPVIANERCGSWYTPPDIKEGSSYFKSTDGHQGQWDFSLRRLNLQLLETINEHGGYEKNSEADACSFC